MILFSTLLLPAPLRASIGSLSHGVEYSVKVAAVDRMGRVSENATILMTLEGIIYAHTNQFV